jgi:hypothetical protein
LQKKYGNDTGGLEVNLMDERLCDPFGIRRIIVDGDVIRLEDTEKWVIGEISLKIYINGT